MTTSSPWAVQRLAADGLGISERTLHRWRAAGLLEPGKHFRRKFPNPNSPLLYHLERCEEAMNEACARQPERLELAPDRSSQSTRRPMEICQQLAAPGESRRSFPTTHARPTQSEAGEDAEPLADGVIHAVAGPIAEDLSGIHGHRPRARLRGRLVH
jgi:hypothetical protein